MIIITFLNFSDKSHQFSLDGMILPHAFFEINVQYIFEILNFDANLYQIDRDVDGNIIRLMYVSPTEDQLIEYLKTWAGEIQIERK